MVPLITAGYTSKGLSFEKRRETPGRKVTNVISTGIPSPLTSSTILGQVSMSYALLTEPLTRMLNDESPTLQRPRSPFDWPHSLPPIPLQ